MEQERYEDTIWKACSDNGKSKPWFVISVIGDSSSIVPTTWEKSAFQASLIETAKGAKECWIVYNGGKGKLSQAIGKAVKNYRITTGADDKSRFKHINMWKKDYPINIKLIAVQSLGRDSEEQRQDETDQHFTVSPEEYSDVHTRLLKRIGQERVKVMTLHKDLTVRIPVIVVVAEGDLKTIKHVEKILKEGIPVVIIKGSGKAADVILEYIVEGKKVLKNRAPLLLGTVIGHEVLSELKDTMKTIKRNKHLISVFDPKDPEQPSMSDTVTSAILLAWSVGCIGETKHQKQMESQKLDEIEAMKQSFTSNVYNIYPIPNLNQIASFEGHDTVYPVTPESEDITPPDVVAKFSAKLVDSNLVSRGMTLTTPNENSLRPLSAAVASSSLSGSKTLRPVKTWLNPSSFPLYFFIAYQLIQLNFKDNEKLYKENFKYLLEKAIEADKLDYVTVLLHEHDVEFDVNCFPQLYNETVKCKLCKDEHAVDCQHFFSVLKTDRTRKKLFEDNSCINAGRTLCRNFLHYPQSTNKSDEKTAFHDLLIWALFAHRPKLATLFWNACEDQLLTALLATGVLKRMAEVAKEIADQSVHEDIIKHLRIFESRCLDMQSHLYTDYPNEAMEIMTTEFTVWDITISPLRCAYDIDFFDFIAHPCAQRCLNKIWYNKLGTNFKASVKKGFKRHKVRGKWTFCRLLAAPFTKFVVNYVIFLIALVIYSAFLLTNLKENYEMGGYEIFVYIWMVTDMVEEYVVPKFHRRMSSTFQTSDQWYRFRRYINDVWNILDTVSYVTTFVAVGLRFTDATRLWSRRIFSFSLFLVYMRFLHVVLIYRKVGVYVILIKEMMRDLARFVVILIVFMMAAGVMYHVNMYPNHPDMWPSKGVAYWRIWDIISLPYWQIYGEMFLDSIIGTNNTCIDNTCRCDASELVYRNDPDGVRCVEYDWILYVIAAVYMLLSNLLLVNLVIALFSARFEKVRTNSEKIWRYIRYSYIMDYRIRVPAVLNLILRPILMIRWLFRRCRACINRVDDVTTSNNENDARSKSLEHVRTLQSMCAVRCT